MLEYISSQIKEDKPIKEKVKNVMKKTSVKQKVKNAFSDDYIPKTKVLPANQDKVQEKQREHLLTWNETMKLLRISTSTLRRWEQEGSIPKAIRIGGRVFFSKSGMNNYIEKLQQNKKTAY